MSEEIKVIAEPRSCSGSTAARRLRRSGVVPAVLNTLAGESALIQLNAHDFERTMSRHAGTQLLVALAVNGTGCKALLREIQRDGITGRIIHADFNEIDPTHKIHVHVAVNLVGIPEGVKNQNGVLEQVLREVEVSCLPEAVVETLTVDVSHLNLGDDITVGDLPLGKDMTLVSHAGDVVATVTEATQEVAATEVEGAEAGKQPEISVKKGKVEEAAPAGGAKK